MSTELEELDDFATRSAIRRPDFAGRKSACGVYFTSDQHFGHESLITRGFRAFSSADEMDEVIIERYCEVVRPGDRVYMLGDISWHKAERTDGLLRRLPGQKFLILGNHDHEADVKKLRNLFGFVRDAYFLKVDSLEHTTRQYVYLHHYACRVWKNSHHGSYHVYGHSHGSIHDDVHARSVDVGVDCWNFYPVAFETLEETMASKNYKPVDHHR